jgi:hypothetical protein
MFRRREKGKTGNYFVGRIYCDLIPGDHVTWDKADCRKTGTVCEDGEPGEYWDCIKKNMKDVKVNKDDRAGILGSHIEFGDTRRGWNFVSLGHGDVDFDAIIRELNQMGYHGPLCVEWEDSGMERMFGAKEACEFTHKINFEPSTVAFDAALKSE